VLCSLITDCIVEEVKRGECLYEKCVNNEMMRKRICVTLFICRALARCSAP